MLRAATQPTSPALTNAMRSTTGADREILVPASTCPLQTKERDLWSGRPEVIDGRPFANLPIRALDSPQLALANDRDHATNPWSACHRREIAAIVYWYIRNLPRRMARMAPPIR